MHKVIFACIRGEPLCFIYTHLYVFCVGTTNDSSDDKYDKYDTEIIVVVHACPCVTGKNIAVVENLPLLLDI